MYLILLLFLSFGVQAFASDQGESLDDVGEFMDRKGVLLPFNVGHVHCDRFNKIWSEQCQDALAQNIYGANWREVKKVILAFQQAVIHRDYRYIKGMTVIPQEKVYVLVFLPDKNVKYSFDVPSENHSIKKLYYSNKLFFKRIPERIIERVKKVKYEDIRLEHYGPRGSAYLDRKCHISFYYDCVNAEDKRVCQILPKIDVLSLDLTKFWD
ncbi:MAG: hypothetical protein RLZZ59_354 [Pseudomonadota bacterium]|jgi:hypothetical protein